MNGTESSDFANFANSAGVTQSFMADGLDEYDNGELFHDLQLDSLLWEPELIMLDESWDNMKEWAIQALPQDAPADPLPQILEEEAALTFSGTGGIDFCCYGMIPNVLIKMVGSMPQLQERMEFEDPHIMFPVAKHGKYMVLKFSDDAIFAQVSKQAEKAFMIIDDYQHVEIVACVEAQTVQEVLRYSKRPGEATLNAEFNIYGHKGSADIIGEKLSMEKVFLQDPNRGVERIDYHNPHVAHFPGLEEPTISIIEPEQTSGKLSLSKMADSRKKAQVFRQAVSSTFKHLTRFRGLESMDGGKHLTTKLLPHQETALSFMWQREFGPASSEFSLWSYEFHISASMYRHKLTDAESKNPPNELIGGILADDMGMGKSLSSLALIMSTKDKAKLWRDAEEITTKQRSASTLIIVPSTLIMDSWMKEISLHLDEEVSVAKYYGKVRDKEISDSLNHDRLNHDIIFTTYHTIAYSHQRGKRSIFNTEWFRIILDEAHMIRRRETTLYQAASELSANFRWCLTGTPIQNHLEDVGSLLSFLRLSQFENKAVFKASIVRPFYEGDETVAAKRFAFLLDCICLRRPQALLHLPTVKDEVRYISFTEEERAFYDETKNLMTQYIREKVSLESDKHNTFGIFQAQLQLRLLCNHGTFQPRFKKGVHSTKEGQEQFFYNLGGHADITCSRCGIPVPVFDIARTSNQIKSHGAAICNECDEAGGLNPTPGTSDGRPSSPNGHFPHTPETKTQDFNQNGHSSKIQALIEDILQVALDNKSIIFSCWTRTLDLLGLQLKRNKILYQRIDGDQTLAQRKSHIDEFTSDEKCHILLMSTGVGAFGLNLTAANRVYILEPQWNPSVESQAVGRVSRFGQKKLVHVIRYIVRETVEIDMQSQQIRKVALAQVGFDDLTAASKP